MEVPRQGRFRLALINDVLDLSRIEAGQLKVTVASFSVEEAIRKVYFGLLPLAERKGLSLSYQFSLERRPRRARPSFVLRFTIPEAAF